MVDMVSSGEEDAEGADAGEVTATTGTDERLEDEDEDMRGDPMDGDGVDICGSG